MRLILTLATAAAMLLSGTADARRHGSSHHSSHYSSHHSSRHRTYHARSYHARAYHPRASRSYHYSAPHTTSGYYQARSGHSVHRPMQADSRPDGATARCRDGTWSFSESRRGTCSHHGGVASWLR